MAIEQTRITFLRHGQPEGEGCARGKTDFALTEKGFEQMLQAATHAPVAQQIITSPLVRCARFAKAKAAEWQVDCLQDASWQEYDFGEWDGLSWQTIEQQDGETLRAFFSNPWQVTPKGAESMATFDQRIEGAWQRLLAQYRGQSVMVVTHAGVMKQLMSLLLQIPKEGAFWQRIYLPYAALMSVAITHDEQGQDWIQVQWPDLAANLK
ncbi:Adenosylcobalamin/alpha-ribazole phosphatase [Vibrio stylophorae]|uniref:Adenosylcobalamin/alpha-ribazole phosphatase n=1 Tax=Vibrio stylophorae TaxID=659351 RepID=A0ABN8DRF5_9VIBR|nr:histidine phosphatase family protein [Vibrio stylophorae]CAH0533731.1 Adenosylcobalamin/alpha-ribazole phosphatase [Vibrio stylophorae]